MNISIEGLKKVFGAVWKSLPTEIVILLSFLVALSQLDFLPFQILQILASSVSVASFAMLFFRIYNNIVHDYVVKKAVREAEKKYISENFTDVRAEYITTAQAENKTIIDTLKTASASLKSIETKEPVKETNEAKEPVIFP